MNRKEHLRIGTICGIGMGMTYLFIKYNKKKKLESKDLLIAGGIFGVCTSASILPDLIEPATNPRHRGIFHSELLLITELVIFVKSLIDKKDISEIEVMEILKLAGLVGYGSHLLADSTTPAGLPLVM